MLASRNVLEPINVKALPKLKGKIVVITGANSGIGKETARLIAKTECKLILGCRRELEGLATQEEIKSSSGNDLIIYKHLDLSSFKSVFTFAEEVLQLGLVYLTLLLLPKLKESSSSRIINVTSEAHRCVSQPHIDEFFSSDYFSPNKYDPIPVYGETKLYVMLSALHLSKVLEETNVSVSCVDPGNVATNILRHFKKYNTLITRFLIWLRFKSAVKAAEEVTCLIFHPHLKENSGKVWKSLEEENPSSLATSEELAKKLWSQTLTVLPKINSK
ncbi:retinol dehydrogenase 13 isoform X2 [Bemisia tabaci]|uniref:retinol dehydrogenase 13 isoform X2 n=1 Tax=Bemisia tabaci TaxID=7038 RepID=UPI003B286FC6